MNHCIKNGIILLGVLMVLMSYAAEKQPESLADVHDAQKDLRNKVVRYFSNSRPAVLPAQPNPAGSTMFQQISAQPVLLRSVNFQIRKLES